MNLETVSTYDTDTLKQQARDHLWMAYQPPIPFESVGGPRVLVEAEGCWMFDSEGNRYLDGVGALEACVAGHCRKSLADVAYAQMNRLEFLDVFRYTSPPAVQLAAKLAAITPGDLSRVHFTPGGSEAVETAIKVVKQYQRLVGETGASKSSRARALTTAAHSGRWASTVTISARAPTTTNHCPRFG